MKSSPGPLKSPGPGEERHHAAWLCRCDEFCDVDIQEAEAALRTHLTQIAEAGKAVET